MPSARTRRLRSHDIARRGVRRDGARTARVPRRCAPFFVNAVYLRQRVLALVEAAEDGQVVGAQRRDGQEGPDPPLRSGSVRPVRRGRKLHRHSQRDERRVGHGHDPAGRAVEVEGDEEERRDERRREDDRDDAAREDREVGGEQAEADSGADDSNRSTADGTRLFSADTRTVCMSIISLSVSM